MNALIEVADAVVAELNTAGFSQVFEAVRRYLPAFKLDELATLRVTVVPKSLTIERADRTTADWECKVDIGVQQKVDAGDLAVLDGLAVVVQEILDRLKFKRLSTMANAICVDVACEPVFDPKHLEEKGVFTSVVTATYRVRL